MARWQDVAVHVMIGTTCQLDWSEDRFCVRAEFNSAETSQDALPDEGPSCSIAVHYGEAAAASELCG